MAPRKMHAIWILTPDNQSYKIVKQNVEKAFDVKLPMINSNKYPSKS